VRFGALILASLLAATAADGQVRLAVKGDGRKVITNYGGGSARGDNWNWLARQHDRRTKYDPLIEKYAKLYRVDPTLVRAVIQVESDFNPQCVSHKGARGLMQLMPGTAKRYGVKLMHDPEDNIRGGVRYLRFLLELFGSDLPRVLAGYNAGENAVIRYGGIPPYAETTKYVKRALTVYYGKPYGGGGVMFAGDRSKATLRGGFTSKMTEPIAAVMPGMRYLGTH
jgi:soluble lytic murein transglycosylase-like protein